MSPRNDGPPEPARPRPASPDRWWDLIERSRRDASDPDEQAEQLVELLQQELTADEIIAFAVFIQERVRDAFRYDLWEIAYLMNGGASEDGFHYFTGWLIGSGRKRYEAALANPAAAAKGIDPDDEPFESEDLLGAPMVAWQAVTGGSMDEYDAVRPIVPISVQGEPFDEDTIDERHPKLALKFGG